MNKYQGFQIRWISAGFRLICVWIIVMQVSSASARPEDLPVRDIQALKQDPRGPFQSIQWVCANGTVLPAKSRCPSPGGRQQGKLKDWVTGLEKESGIFLNVVLAGSDHQKVWDDSGAQSRLKQYALVQFLIQADQGWIYRKARYYRGAVQAEDESRWGVDFLNWLLSDAGRLETRFFQIREACRSLPHFSGNKNRLQAIRTLSKTLSDEIPSFMALRIKIHGQPGSEDLQAVKDFARENQAALTAQQITLFSQLLEQMSAEYAVSPSDALAKLLAADRLRHPALSGPAEALAVSSSALRKGTVLFPEKIPIRSGTWQTCFWPFGAV